MPRVKVSEFKAKTLVFPYLGFKFGGIRVTATPKFRTFSPEKKYVLKVDQGVKKRQKSGLMAIGLTAREIPQKIEQFKKKGFDSFLVEDFIPHKAAEEKFLAFDRQREGVALYYSASGGVEIEAMKNAVKKVIVGPKTIEIAAKDLGVPVSALKSLTKAFDDFYFSFMEINPLIVINGKLLPLDLAVEADSAGEFFVGGSWDKSDIVEPATNREKEEFEIAKLARGSSASFKLVVLNPNGSIFTILSGGGASIVLADEIGNIGKGRELANYAEYSGGPTEEETYIFAKNILSLALRSTAKVKKIYIAGGVANFTDIRATFKGIIKALSEKRNELKAQKIKVYVRRGGPYQDEGLAMMSNFLTDTGLLGEVMGPERVLTEVVTTN